MTTLRISLGLALAAAIAPVPPQAAEDCPIFVLRRTDSGVTLERQVVTPGEHVLSRGVESGIIDVISPVGPGVSGSLAQLGGGGEIVLHFADGALGVTDRIGDAAYSRPTRNLADLSSEDVRVSVVGGDGSRAAFLVEGHERVARDDGPVMDMFRGRVPLGPDDYAVVTDTTAREAGAPVSGSAALVLERWPFVTATGPGGREACFLVDLGAGSTVVGRDFVGDVPIGEAAMVQYSLAGRELLKYAPSGATGPTLGVIGQARLPELVVGGLHFRDASVDVMEALPDLFGRRVDGILGLDLLRRCGVLTLALGAPGTARSISGQPMSGQTEPAQPVPTLSMSAQAAEAPAGSFELPFACVGSHLVVRGKLGDTSVHWLLDSGAPGPLLDASAAQAAGLALDGSPTRDGRGLDGGRADVHQAAPATLTLGTHAFANVACVVSALPVFDLLRAEDQHVGLLGNSFLARFARIEVDFGRRMVRWVP